MTGELKHDPFYGEDALTDEEACRWLEDIASAENSASSVIDLYDPETGLRGNYLGGDSTWFDD